MKTYFINSSIPYGSNMYVLEDGGEIAVIDPSRPFSDVDLTLKIPNKKYKYIILTHSHFDHMLYLDDWCSKTGLPVYIHKSDSAALGDSHLNCYKYFLNQDKAYYGVYELLSEKLELSLGSAALRVIETPGHTPGSVAILFEDDIFVGDTVFADGGVGRCDLPGGDVRQMLKSITKLREIGKNLNVYPGHGPMTKLSKI